MGQPQMTAMAKYHRGIATAPRGKPQTLARAMYPRLVWPGRGQPQTYSPAAAHHTTCMAPRNHSRCWAAICCLLSLLCLVRGLEMTSVWVATSAIPEEVSRTFTFRQDFRGTSSGFQPGPRMTPWSWRPLLVQPKSLNCLCWFFIPEPPVGAPGPWRRLGISTTLRCTTQQCSTMQCCTSQWCSWQCQSRRLPTFQCKQPQNGLLHPALRSNQLAEFLLDPRLGQHPTNPP